MADTFKNKITKEVGTSATVIYTAGENGGAPTSIIIGMNIANRTSSQITVDVTITDVSPNPDVVCFLVKAAPVPVGGSLIAVGGNQKIVLENGDKISVTSSAASSADVSVSILEQT